MNDTKAEQIELAEKLQMALLRDFERIIMDGTITPTDRATLYRLFKDSGWSLDPNTIPQGLRDKLVARIDPTMFEEGEYN